MKKDLCITIFPEFFQNEGVNPTLDRLAEISVTEITITPWVATLSDSLHGTRQPPLDDNEGLVRIHDRPLWGKLDPYLRWAPSYTPNKNLYRGLKYQPAQTDNLTAQQGAIVEQIIKSAHVRGMKCYFQWIPAMPPGLDEKDLPRLPNGTLPRRRLATTGSLASHNILDYTTAYLRDLIEAYPDIDGFRPDWPEYPPYYLESALLDFSAHAEKTANENGFDFQEMQEAVNHLHKSISNLTNGALHSWLDSERRLYHTLRPLVAAPALVDWLAFKALLSTRFLDHIRKAITEAGAPEKKLLANAFPPPLCFLSGLSYEYAALICDAICMKLYTMHWPMIVRLYANHIISINPDLDEGLLVHTVASLFDLLDEGQELELGSLKYPAPDQKHPVGQDVQRHKIMQAMDAVSGRAKLYPIVHGYGPLEDFRERLRIGLRSPAPGVGINRYAFLSDAKLEAIKSLLEE